MIRWAVYIRWYSGEIKRIETWDPKACYGRDWWVLAALPLPEVTVVEGGNAP